jgi:hypothetical protein
MADDRTKCGAADGNRINLLEVSEVEFWAKKLGVSREQLARAVQKVGPIVADVQRELGK